MIILSSLMTHMHTGRQGVSVANIDFLVIAKKKKIKDEKKPVLKGFKTFIALAQSFYTSYFLIS